MTILILILLLISDLSYADTSISGNITINSNIELGPPGVEVLPLGDSITDGFFTNSNGYRGPLQDELGNNKTKWAVTMIGQYSKGSGTYQRSHAGATGETASQIQSRVNTNLALFSKTKFKKHSKVLLHAGTNDMTGSLTDPQIQAVADTIAAMCTTIHNSTNGSGIDIYVALIIPSTGGRDGDITKLNTVLPATLNALGYSNLYYVDMNTAFRSDYFGLCSGDWATNCMADSLHPSSAGYSTMAKMWARCINSSTAVGCNGN